MKKILSFVLVLAMIASMMCISVSAANVVGSHGSGSVADGVEKPAEGSQFTHKNNTAEIKANVSGTNVVRYAVDLVYTQKTITIAGNLEWDVNKLHYEGTKTITVVNAGETEKDEVALENATDNDKNYVTDIGNFAVTNYSNAAVNVTANVVGDAATTRLIHTVLHEVKLVENRTGGSETNCANQIGATDGSTSTYSTVPAVAGVGINQPGYTHTVKYAADMYCADWATALYDLNNNTSLNIATITFTIAPAN